MNFRPKQRYSCRQATSRLAIGHASELDRVCNEKALRIDEHLALAPRHVLVAVEAAPLSVVFIDWASMITTVGSVRRPAFSRAAA